MKFLPRRKARLGIVEWAEEKIVLPSWEPRPGPLRLETYQKGILSEYQNPLTRQISLMMCTQSGKTLMTQVIIGFAIENDPQPMMWVGASKEDVKKFIQGKLEPLVDSAESVRELVATPRGKKGRFNSLNIDFVGGSLTFGHAGSPRSLRSTTARLVVADEVDMYEGSVDSSNPLGAIRQRLQEYGADGKLIVLSTPTIKGESLIEAENDKGDGRQFNIDCPHCSTKHPVEIEHIYNEKLWCPSCASNITEYEREECLHNGIWVPTRLYTDHASFHLSRLSVARTSIKEIIRQQGIEDEKSFTVNILALPYELIELKALDPDELMNIFSTQPFERIDAVTVGVDVQQNRLEYQVQYWSGDSIAYIQTHATIPKDKNDVDLTAWWTIEEVLGDTMPDKVYIDKSYDPTYVDKGLEGPLKPWVDADIVAPIRGDSTSTSSFGKDMNRPAARGHTIVSVDEAKLIIRLMIDTNKLNVNRYDTPDDILDQIASESLQNVVSRNGKTMKRWVKKTSHIRNEALDCMVYGLAARRSLGLEYTRELIEDDAANLIGTIV